MSVRNKIDSIGSGYEKCADALVGQVANMIKVPREGDFGIDFYCEPRVSIGPTMETVAQLCSLQVRGGTRRLTYGGLNKKGKWKDHDFAWLRSLIAPLYLARVDKSRTAVDLFSLCPIWLICWQAGHPFEIVCTTQAPSAELCHVQEPRASAHPRGNAKSDGMRWTVDLGPPFLRLTHENMNDSAFCELAVAVLRSWIVNDRLTLIYTHLSVPVVPRVIQWRTEPPGILDVRTTYLGNTGTGMNIAGISQTVAPILVSLLFNLKFQNNEAAYNFLPALQWLADSGYLDRLGQGLLDDLRRTQAASLPPLGETPRSQ
jgi:hypothetical protein